MCVTVPLAVVLSRVAPAPSALVSPSLLWCSCCRSLALLGGCISRRAAPETAHTKITAGSNSRQGKHAGEQWCHGRGGVTLIVIAQWSFPRCVPRCTDCRAAACLFHADSAVKRAKRSATHDTAHDSETHDVYHHTCTHSSFRLRGRAELTIDIFRAGRGGGRRRNNCMCGDIPQQMEDTMGRQDLKGNNGGVVERSAEGGGAQWLKSRWEEHQIGGEKGGAHSPTSMSKLRSSCCAECRTLHIAAALQSTNGDSSCMSRGRAGRGRESNPRRAGPIEMAAAAGRHVKTGAEGTTRISLRIARHPAYPSIPHCHWTLTLTLLSSRRTIQLRGLCRRERQH